jgi:CCR4-NOT transcription complex subunit 3
MRQQEAAKQQQQQAAVAAAQLQTQQQLDAKAVSQARMQAGPGSGAAGGTSALDILTSGLAGVGLGSGASSGPSVVGGMSVDSRGSASPVPPSSSSSARGGRATSGGSAALDLGTPYVSALSDSFQNVPSPSDNDRGRTYAPQNPYPTPASYPTTPSPIFSNPAVFEKLGTDCLFFIFYYAQGTYQQYLAARELKKQSWRFHKKYMTWFQRHEEPKITTDEYEQGTYVYFDYETGWCTRIKTDFRFEYSYLEDSLQ